MVSLLLGRPNPANNGTNSNVSNNIGTNAKYIIPSVKLDDNVEALLFHQSDPSAVASDETRGELSKRFLHPLNLKNSTVNYKVHIPNFVNLSPLQLGSRFITDFNKIDSMTPTDIYNDETMDRSATGGLDNYYFDNEKGLGDFHRFEKINQINLPDKVFDEFNSSNNISKVGMFNEIERSWIISDNKLILWNYNLPKSSFNLSAQFLTIDQLKHAILMVKIVKPKTGIFSADANYLLLIATTLDFHIFIIKYDRSFNNLEIFNPKLSVSIQGLNVNNIVCHPTTNDIYFTGQSDGINVWKLEYTNKSSFIKNRCDKICLTKTGISSVIPSKLPGFDYLSSNTSNTASVPETVSQLEIDPERNILYTLSNKSVIRVYKLQPDHQQINEASRLLPTQIFKSASNMFANANSFKVFEKFKIINIQHISMHESAAVQLIAITTNGCRILLKLGSSLGFGSFISSTFNSAYNSASSTASLRLNLSSIKFPPSPDVPVINSELDSFTRSKQHLSQLIQNQQQSQLLKNTKFAKVISPGVFICVKKTKKSDKLFISIANYGFLKKNNKLVEDAEFINYTNADEGDAYTYIQDVIQLTPSMNATDTPNGYANVLASQYSKQPLKLAILTNFGILIYQYRTSDQILRSLNESTIENFIEENGFEETCSTLLYLACSYGHYNATELFKRKAQLLFSSCSNNPRLINKTVSVPQAPHYQLPTQQSDTHPTVEDVVLSDRFYGTSLLISRLFRAYWNKKVFDPLPYIKFGLNGAVEKDSMKEDNLIIQGLKIDKKQIEFFIGSVIVLIEFFVENGNSILGLNAPNYSSDPSQFETEVCLRAEHIAFTSIIKSLNSIKEGLSFLMVLLEEIQQNQSNVNDIFKFLSLTNQANLLKLSFKDLLLPNQDVKNLIKDLLSSIINKNILKGGSIDLIASSLQGRCGSFCSTDDVLIFKAIENLTRAKDVGNKDVELKSKCLKTSINLFEEAYKSLTLENIENSINIMLELKYYVGAVDLLLRLAAKMGSTASQNHTHPKAGTLKVLEDSKKKNHDLYELVFKILRKVDLEALRVSDSNNQLLINEILETRDATYDTCFASQDKAFHYEFYEWFIEQGISDRLLEIRTPFILPFLEEKSINSLHLSNLLWLFHAKRENYFEAASLLYALSISEFDLNLNTRIEYLARANGFCNCVCPPNIRQRMIQLSLIIQELFDVANLQLDVLSTIKSDARISNENKKVAVDSLNFKVLTISDLFNNYTDPLGYYDLCLLIFKISDYKNTDDILKRWELFFEKIFHEFSNGKKNVPLYILLEQNFTAVGPKLSSNDLVFPIDELVKLTSKYIQESIEDVGPLQKPPRGALVDMFVRSGVSYQKLYIVLRSFIEHNTFEIYPGFVNALKKGEMVYLIQTWYAEDKKLRSMVTSDVIDALTEYSLELDPLVCN